MTPHSLDSLPLSLLFLLSLLVSLASVEAGFRLGVAYRRRGGESLGTVGNTVGATLGLLAFILAFTFGIASNRYEDRKALVLDQANALGTLILRTQLLPEPQRGESKRLVEAYIETIAQFDPSAQDLEAAMSTAERCAAMHSPIWAEATAASEAQANPNTALYASACNEAFDLFDSRIAKGIARIPGPVWFLLFTVAALSMVAVGYQTGLEGDRRSPGCVLLTFTFCTVIVLIADLDNGVAGAMRVSQDPIVRLHKSLAKN